MVEPIDVCPKLGQTRGRDKNPTFGQGRFLVMLVDDTNSSRLEPYEAYVSFFDAPVGTTEFNKYTSSKHATNEFKGP